MKIAIIGAGSIGARLARGWAAAGHEIVLGAREPEGAKAQAIVAADPVRISACPIEECLRRCGSDGVVVVAVHPPALREVCERMGPVGDRVLLDVMNVMFQKPEPYGSASEALAAWTGSNRVVKILNNTGAENLERPEYGGTPIDTFYCADDSRAGETAGRLAEELGFVAWNAGGLENAPLLENFAALWVTLAIKQGYGRDIAFKLLRR